MKKAAVFLYFFFFSSMLFSVTAQAYIDPSAMTYMIQIAAGVAIAAGAGLSYYFQRIKRRFSGRSKGAGRAVSPSRALDDDDDTGYGDYELDETPRQQPQNPTPAPAADPARVPEFAFEEPAPEPPSGGPDPFDETGGMAGLLAENRELRRLLAQERQNVEELKRALHICTAPRR